MGKKLGKAVWKYLKITLGSFFFAVGIALFLDPNNLAPGGASGLAIIINRLTGIETGTMIFLLNVPLILLGLWKFGARFIIATFYSIIMVSASTNILSLFPPLTTNPVPAVFAGAVFIGIGMGIVLRCGTTTGGTDIVVKLLRIKYRHLKSGTLFFIIDIIIVLLSGIIFQNVEAMIYSSIAVLLSSTILDMVLYGKDEAKMIYIISNRQQNIADRLLHEVVTGITFLDGRGGYEDKEKLIILCVVKKQLAGKIEEIVRAEDEKAFMIVSNATEIFGEGYKSFYGEIF